MILYLYVIGLEEKVYAAAAVDALFDVQIRIGQGLCARSLAMVPVPGIPFGRIMCTSLSIARFKKVVTTSR